MKICLMQIDGVESLVAKDSYDEQYILKRSGWTWNGDLVAWTTTKKNSIIQLVEYGTEKIILQKILNLNLFVNFRIKVENGNIFIMGDTWSVRDYVTKVGFKWNGYDPEANYKGSVKDFILDLKFIKSILSKELFDLIVEAIPEHYFNKNNEKLDIKKSDNIDLYQHQKDGVQFIHERPLSLLNYSMGSGKTFCPIAYAHTMGLKLFAVVPALTRLNFFKECEKYGLTSSLYPKLPTMKAKYKKIYGKLSWKESQSAVTSYATLNLHTKKNPTALLDIVNKFDILVLDESQYIKNYKAQRTQIILQLIELFKDAGKKIVFLSGTPIMSRPVELYTTFKTVKDNMESYYSFAMNYNGASQGAYGLQLGRATNTEELYNRMRSFTSRVRKEDCLDLPEKVRTMIDLDGSAKIKRPNDDDYDTALEFLGAYKKATALGKIKATTEYVNEIAKNEPVVLFSWFTDVNNKLATGLRKKGLKVAQIHSKLGLSAVEKEKIVSDFQAGKYDVIIGGIKIMGVGLTLTRASHVVFNDFSWTPTDLMQAEDRIHRIGQLLSCSIHYMKAQDEFDDMLWSLLMNKFTDVIAIMDNDTDREFSTSGILHDMMQMWKPKKTLK